MKQIDDKAKHGFEEEGSNHETAQRNEKARRSIDSEGSNDIKRRLQRGIRLNLFWLYDQAYDWNHHRKPQNFNDAVDENAQQHQRRPFALARIEQPVGPSQNRINGIGVRHVEGQAGDASKLGFKARFKLTSALGFCRTSLVSCPRLKVARRHAAHRQHAVRTAGHAWPYNGAGADPHAVLEGDVAHHEVEGGFLEVVVAAEEKRALGEAAVVSEGDLAEVVDPHVFADPAVVAHGELPRVFDGDARFEDHTAPDVGSEKSQQGALEGAGPGEPGLEEHAGDEDPQYTREPRARAVVRVVELVESRRRHQMLIERAVFVSTGNSMQSTHKSASCLWPHSFK